MANNDPAMLDPTDTSEENLSRVNQRYALLTMYYASDQDQWVNQEGWLSEDECTWSGVMCGNDVEADGNRRRLQTSSSVTAIVMEDNGMLGSLPADLALLTELTTLNLGGNGITGQLPESFSNLTLLQTLDLSGNNMTGTIPLGVESMTGLSK
jgi:Leucine-rich repeat (LRR) protein